LLGQWWWPIRARTGPRCGRRVVCVSRARSSDCRHTHRFVSSNQLPCVCVHTSQPDTMLLRHPPTVHTTLGCVPGRACTPPGVYSRPSYYTHYTRQAVYDRPRLSPRSARDGDGEAQNQPQDPRPPRREDGWRLGLGLGSRSPRDKG
jgi:hypothetical protein